MLLLTCQELDRVTNDLVRPVSSSIGRLMGECRNRSRFMYHLFNPLATCQCYRDVVA
jgi:hypothetical protein